ncbi:MAG: methionine ABC transporter ATP-binding protein [Negativicutes bacterium]|nr:methionine ABC transporter ATP-binding protein [Negativicutes bacterium]
MIELTGITKVYPGQATPIQALKGIDLRVAAGEIYGIVGKSGAGKSTLIRCINMLERPTDGTVTVDGQELTALSGRRLRQARVKIGMIFQHFNLLSSRTVFDNVAFPLELAGKSKQDIADEVFPLLELIGLTDRKDQYPAQLSGGQKQRVAIARALASKPKVLLCDEATSALDPQTTRSILELLKDINRKFRLTIVLITHEMQVIKEICDRVAVIEDGVIIEQGRVVDLFVRPQTATTRDFIRTIISHDLPASLAGHTFYPDPVEGGSLMLRLTFLGRSAEEPVIARLVRKFHVDVNILFGSIDTIQETLFGTLVVELSGEQPAVLGALNYLQHYDLGIEVIGYVAKHQRITG